jgi:proline iminopeptidase
MDAYYHRFLCRADPWPDCLKEALGSVNMVIYTHLWGPSEFTATGTLKGYERVDRLKELKLPVLFTCGEFDEAAPATTRYYSSVTPGSEVVVLKRASPCHLFEQPDQCNSVVRRFLAKADLKQLAR